MPGIKSPVPVGDRKARVLPPEVTDGSLQVVDIPSVPGEEEIITVYLLENGEIGMDLGQPVIDAPPFQYVETINEELALLRSQIEDIPTNTVTSLVPECITSRTSRRRDGGCR